MTELKIKNLVGRGRPILLLGATGSGKSRLTRSIISDNCQKIIKLREGNGMMTVESSEIVVSPNIPKDSIVIYGKIDYAEKYLLYDENELLCDLLYYSTKSYVDATNKYKSKDEALIAFEKALDEEIDRKVLGCEDYFKLAFKIKNSNGIKEKLKNLIKKFDIVQLKAIYLNTFLNNKGQYIKEFFKDEINKKTLLDYKLTENIDDFWSLIIDSYNSMCDELFDEISSFNKSKNIKTDLDTDKKEFAICVSDLDIDNELVKNIITSGTNSISHFIKDFSIYGHIEADSEISSLVKCHFNGGDNEDSFVIKLIDTMGFFHQDSPGVNVECENVIDQLSLNQCSDVIYVLKANDDALNKKSAQILRELKKTCKKELNLHICFTHFDEYIIDELNGDDEGLFDSEKIINDKLIEEKIDKLRKKYINYLEISDSKKSEKVSIDKEFSYFSYPTINQSVDEILMSHGMEYNIGILKLIKNCLRDMKNYDISIKGSKKIDYKLDIDKTTLYDISTIYFDLTENIAECEKSMLNLHFKTYKAVINKWLKYGVKFISNAGDERTGYIRLRTYFIEYITNFINNSIIPELSIGFDNILVDKKDSKALEEYDKIIKKYLSQNIGKMVARDLLDGILKGHRMIYDLRLDMYAILDEIRTRYFPRPNVTLDEITQNDERDFIKILEKSIQESLLSFVKMYCNELN
ncbi:MAG: hypothetical protein J6P02_04055 [Lachnospiraceae bacterium]|nr:hypothetical protein [Lachnospiraceae bacterium]